LALSCRAMDRREHGWMPKRGGRRMSCGHLLSSIRRPTLIAGDGIRPGSGGGRAPGPPGFDPPGAAGVGRGPKKKTRTWGAQEILDALPCDHSGRLATQNNPPRPRTAGLWGGVCIGLYRILMDFFDTLLDCCIIGGADRNESISWPARVRSPWRNQSGRSMSASCGRRVTADPSTPKSSIFS